MLFLFSLCYDFLWVPSISCCLLFFTCLNSFCFLTWHLLLPFVLIGVLFILFSLHFIYMFSILMLFVHFLMICLLRLFAFHSCAVDSLCFYFSLCTIEFLTMVSSALLALFFLVHVIAAVFLHLHVFCHFIID